MKIVGGIQVLSCIAFFVFTGASPSMAGQSGEVSPGPPRIDGIVGDGEYPFQSALADGHVTVFWRFDPGVVVFAVKARTTGWVAVGFDPEKAMKGADMVVGWVTDEGEAVVRDQYCKGAYGPHKPDAEFGGRDDLLGWSALEVEGTTVLEFSRARDTGDRFDKPFRPGQEVELLWATGAGDEPSGKHDRRGEAGLVLKGSLEASSSESPRAGETVAVEAGRKPMLWPIHAALMDMTILLALIGLFVARRKAVMKDWLGRHETVGLTAAGLILIAMGWAVYMVSFKSGEHLGGFHGIIGAIAAALLLPVPVMGFLMTRKPKSFGSLRKAHRLLGRLAILAMILGSLTGVFAAGLF